jgi:hypothetical protein
MKMSFLFSRNAVFFAVIILIFLSGGNLFSQGFGTNKASYESFPESWETRLKYKYLLLAPIGSIPSVVQRTNEQNVGTDNVLLRIEIKGKEFHYYFLILDAIGKMNLARRGNISIKRNRETGRFEYITFLLRDNPGCFARIYPDYDDDRSTMDVTLYGKKIYKQIKLYVRFNTFLTAPVSDIMRITAERIDWDLMAGEGERSASLIDMTATIRKRLPHFLDCEDGAYDSTGNPVYIETGLPSAGGVNCSGFAKWVVDGYYFPLTGSYMDVEGLKIKRSNYRGNRWSRRYEDERDPYFGLDWSRNLALTLEEVRTGGKLSDPEAFDVRHITFFNYIEDVGYPVADLELLLYLLARRYPNRFYLGSINQPYGEELSLRQHTHMVVFIPFFSESGEFRVIVMERGDETSLDSIKARYINEYVHLVAIESKSEYSPLTLPRE